VYFWLARLDDPIQDDALGLAMSEVKVGYVREVVGRGEYTGRCVTSASVTLG